MPLKMERDLSRFRDIVRGRIRENLKRYITHGELIGRKGDDLVSIPLPQLDVPHFRYGQNGSGGVGQGDGEIGQAIGKGEAGEGLPAAGDAPGEHLLEVELSWTELAKILGEHLQLPRIEPRGKALLNESKNRYTSVRRSGPESLRHFKRTYVQALRRQLRDGSYNSEQPVIVPHRDDRRYRASKSIREPRACAAILYIMDVSGSMTDDQKEIVRTESFWIDTWLRSQYQGLQRRYIIHDATASEVDEHTFYHTRESGGTRISSAYRTAQKILERDFPPADWNIYFFQFSDGDNWGEDNQPSITLLKGHLLPASNLFCYGQVESPYGSGEYMKTLDHALSAHHDNLVLSHIANREAIYDSIKTFLGRGK